MIRGLQVPYGKAFHVELEWTASQTQAGKVRLQVEGGVVFEKRLLVGGIIKKATYEASCIHVRKLWDIEILRPLLK